MRSNKLMPKKIGIIGTSSSGKTTLCYEILWRLKKAGVTCDGVLQQDRRISFDPKLLDINELAQFSIISNQMKMEADICMAPGVEMVVSDRSPLDLYAYHLATFGGNKYLSQLVHDWCENTFEKLFVLRPVKYEKTPARTITHEFRMQVFEHLMLHVAAYTGDNLEIEPENKIEAKAWRKELPFRIVRMSGHSIVFNDQIVYYIKQYMHCPVLLGGSFAFSRASQNSDIDIYVMQDDLEKIKIQGLSDALGKDIEVHSVPNVEVWNYLIDEGFKLVSHATEI